MQITEFGRFNAEVALGDYQTEPQMKSNSKNI